MSPHSQDTSPIRSLISSGTKVWLDSIDPDLVLSNHKSGATGATSNPIIVANLIKTGRWDQDLMLMRSKGMSPDQATWALTDQLVSAAENVFLPVFEQTKGNDGYVSFELDPLLEDVDCPLSFQEKTTRYIELGRKWSSGHPSRMIKVPATPAGIKALETLAADGIALNVTLLFSVNQYRQARDAIYSGYLKTKNKASFKSVFSIFVSRLDVYSEQYVHKLKYAQGYLGIYNAKKIWNENREFWNNKGTALQQELIFASTGTKKPEDPKWKYVEALAGSDIQTNPPETNAALESSGHLITSHIAKPLEKTIVDELLAFVDQEAMEQVLMREGLAKFAEPQKDLIRLVTHKFG